MSESRKPDLDRVREALREHDERPAADDEQAATDDQSPADDEEQDDDDRG